MKSSTCHIMLRRASGKKALVAIVFASAICGAFLTAAHADNDNRNNGNGKPNQYQNQSQNKYQNQSQNRNKSHPNNDGQYDRYGNRNIYYGYRPDYRPPYYYARPVYVPPPVYYQPWQSPGINLVFPLDLR